MVDFLFDGKRLSWTVRSVAFCFFLRKDEGGLGGEGGSGIFEQFQSGGFMWFVPKPCVFTAKVTRKGPTREAKIEAIPDQLLG